MPSTPLIRFLLRHCLMGAGTGVALVAGLVATNPLGMTDALMRTATWPLALGMLTFAFAATFGSLAMGAAVWLLPWEAAAPPPAGEEVAAAAPPPADPGDAGSR